MKRIKPWFGAGITAVMLTAGCAHAPTPQIAKGAADSSAVVSVVSYAPVPGNEKSASEASTTSVSPAPSGPDLSKIIVVQSPSTTEKAATSTPGPVPNPTPPNTDPLKDVFVHSIPENKAAVVVPAPRWPETPSHFIPENKAAVVAPAPRWPEAPSHSIPEDKAAVVAPVPQWPEAPSHFIPENKAAVVAPTPPWPEAPRHSIPESKAAAVARWTESPIHFTPENKAAVVAPTPRWPETPKTAAAPMLVEKPVEKPRWSDPAPAVRQTKWETGNLVAPPVLERVAAKTPVPNRMAHAPDYSWLCGELQYSRYHRNWRLRYAGLDERDLYGGSVTLADGVRIEALADGRYVRIEGRFANPDEGLIAPLYEVTSIQPLEK